MARTTFAIARIASRAILVCILAGTGVMLYGYITRSELPAAEDVVPVLQVAPRQTPAEPENFTLNYSGQRYVIQPQAHYELWGMVVSRNDIHAFDDIYHDARSVDVQDLCVIWGENVQNEIYKRIRFWSEPFTCNYEYSDSAVAARWKPTMLSNNHLLSDRDEVRRLLQSVHIGDQVRLSGRLVNYFRAGESEAVRRTSLRRDDTGNGACEVFFVTEADVLRSFRPELHRAIDFFRSTLLWLTPIELVLLLALPYLELQARHS